MQLAFANFIDQDEMVKINMEHSEMPWTTWMTVMIVAMRNINFKWY